MTETPYASLGALDIAAHRAAVPTADVQGAINNLMQAYALLSDHGRREELASMFTADAIWDGREIGYGSARGPADIADVVLSHFRPDEPMVHLPGPPLLAAVSDTEVEAYSWCLATRMRAGGTSPLIYFAYEDSLRLVSGSWLFSRRVLRLRFRDAVST